MEALIPMTQQELLNQLYREYVTLGLLVGREAHLHFPPMGWFSLRVTFGLLAGREAYLHFPPVGCFSL